MSSGQPSPRDLWEQRYAAPDYLYGTEPNTFLAEHVAQLPDGPVLCLAEGEGRNSVHLARCGREVHGIDLTPSGVAKTLRLAERNGVTVHAVVGDLAETDLGTDRWGVIVSIFAHMPPAVRRDLHTRVVRALRPGGVLLLEAYTPSQIGRGTGGPAVAELTMTLDALRDELAGLVFEHALECERDVVEGSGHTGVGAVVQVIARKPD